MNRFKFIGTNGSMGLQQGQKYFVDTHKISGTVLVTVHLSSHSINIPYTSLEAFRENWKPVDDNDPGLEAQLRWYEAHYGAAQNRMATLDNLVLRMFDLLEAIRNVQPEDRTWKSVFLTIGTAMTNWESLRCEVKNEYRDQIDD